MGSGPKAGVIFRDVFQHTAENAGKLRETIVDDVLRCIRNAERPGSRPLLDDSRIDMGEEAYELLKNKYDNKCDSLLYHGYFSLGRLTLLDGLSWKWTEATGKYIGCQFWSKRAKALLDDAIDSRRMDLSLPDAWDIAECLCKRNPSRDAKITHEHVYPRKEFRKLPFDTPNQSKDVVRAFIRQIVHRLCGFGKRTSTQASWSG